MGEPGDSFLARMEPLVKEGNPYASVWTLRMMAAGDDPEAQQAVIDSFNTFAGGQFMAGLQQWAANVADEMRQIALAFARAMAGAGAGAQRDEELTFGKGPPDVVA